MSKVREIAVLLFDGFETLDVMGPVELLGLHPNMFSIKMISEDSEIVTSAQGIKILCDDYISNGLDYDVILVPGGQGTRREIENQDLLDWIKNQSATAEYITSVCTGSALLAKAGVLQNKKATTNKMNFQWVASNGPDVNWVKKARWVEDGKFFTSSGVSAGMDMTLALIETIAGTKAAEDAALWAEYEWHRDAGYDPFAARWEVETDQ